MTRVNVYEVEVRYTGAFESYEEADFIANAHARIDRGYDPYLCTEEVADADVEAVTTGYTVDNRYPCNKLAYVRWAEVAEEADEV